MRSTDVAPWEPASFPSPQRFHAFAHLRDLPSPQRSTLRALNEHRVRCLHKPEVPAVNGRWKTWSVEDDWAGRLLAYDGHVDALRREKVMTEQRQLIEKHQRSLAATLQTSLIPTKILLQKLGTPGFDTELANGGALTILREALRANALVPSIIAAERAAHGLVSPLEVVVDDRREMDRSRALADIIAGNPRYVECASDILTELAQAETGDDTTH